MVIPIVIYGISFISRMQLWTQPLWLALQFVPRRDRLGQPAFVTMAQIHRRPWRRGRLLDLLLFGAAASILFSLVAQIGEQVDYLRFLPRDRRTSRTSWWTALLSAGPGWIIFGALKLLLGSFLAYFALSHGVTSEQAAEPAHMYLEAFRYVLSQPDLALALTGTFVILSQVKINVTNAYAGSIAWSNFFSRLTHSHPGRVVWLVFNVMLALLLMEIGVYKAIEQRWRSTPTSPLPGSVRWSPTSSSTSRWASPAAHRVQPRAPLRHQSGRRRRHADRDHRLDLGVLRPVGTDGEGALGLRGAGGRLRHRAADRMGHRRQILHRAQAQAKLAEPRRSSAVSASIRSSRRTWPPAPPMPARSARCAVRWTPGVTTSARRTAVSASSQVLLGKLLPEPSPPGSTRSSGILSGVPVQPVSSGCRCR